MTVVGRILARLGNKNALYSRMLEDYLIQQQTQHKHVHVHKGTPKDRYSVPILYLFSSLSVVFALQGAYDMMMNRNRKVE